MCVCVCVYILRVPDQNGVSLLYIMLEVHHSGREPSNYVGIHCVCVCVHMYVFVCVCAYMHVCALLCLYVCVCVCV